jgi:hypothetical protein
MNISAKLMLAIAVFAFSMADIRAQDENIADVVVSGTYSVPLKKNPVSYPQIAKNEGVEGWVVLSFIVKADGKPVMEGNKSARLIFSLSNQINVYRKTFSPNSKKQVKPS